jgi:hypothetical protein
MDDPCCAISDERDAFAGQETAIASGPASEDPPHEFDDRAPKIETSIGPAPTDGRAMLLAPPGVYGEPRWQ